jgi:chemotaxis protein methyltransferase CheR
MKDGATTRRRSYEPVSASLTNEQFHRLKEFIESELGIRMPPAKKVMLESRLQKRLRALEMSSYEEYLRFVFADGSSETELLHMIDSVTTNKTEFFRESDHFDYLLETVLPQYQPNGTQARRPLQVWSAASSTGEEPYTLAMVLEEFRREHSGFEYQVLGTDISTSVLERGRRAIYPEDRVAPVPEELKRRYLLRSKDRSARLVRIKPELRRRVEFQRLNLMSPRYGLNTKFEVIFCRNVIIYFERPNQLKLLRKLYDYMTPGGYLFLGHSETMTGMDLPLYSVAPTVYRKPE